MLQFDLCFDQNKTELIVFNPKCTRQGLAQATTHRVDNPCLQRRNLRKYLQECCALEARQDMYHQTRIIGIFTMFLQIFSRLDQETRLQTMIYNHCTFILYEKLNFVQNSSYDDLNTALMRLWRCNDGQG